MRTKEKWLWGGMITFATVALLLSLLLFSRFPGMYIVATTSTDDSSSSQQLVTNNEDDPKVAQAGDLILRESEFIEGMKAAFSDEYILLWMERTVVQLEAQKLGIQVSRTQIEQELREMQSGYDSEQEFYRVMKEQLGFTPQEVRDDILHQLLLEEIAIHDMEVSEADVDRYIAENPDQFISKEEIRYSLIMVNSMEQGEQVLEQLANGVDFGQLAKDMSIDEGTAELGGDSGWMDQHDPFIVPVVKEVLGNMQVGDISRLILVDEGQWVVLMLMGRRVLNPLDDAAIRNQLKREIALSKGTSLFGVVQDLFNQYDAIDFLHQD
jgi:foldase protein PrsA